MNMVSDAFIADMEEATAILTEDESVKGVILTSGKKTFMAGADLKQLVQGFGKLTARQAYDFSQRATGMHRAMEKSGKPWRSVEHTSELQSLMSNSYAVFCLKKKINKKC